MEGLGNDQGFYFSNVPVMLSKLSTHQKTGQRARILPFACPRSVCMTEVQCGVGASGFAGIKVQIPTISCGWVPGDVITND